MDLQHLDGTNSLIILIPLLLMFAYLVFRKDKPRPTYKSVAWDDLRELALDQTVTIKKLQEQIDSLVEERQRRQDWLDKAKREAGYRQSVSFDEVWKDVLDRAHASDQGRDPDISI